MFLGPRYRTKDRKNSKKRNIEGPNVPIGDRIPPRIKTSSNTKPIREESDGEERESMRELERTQRKIIGSSLEGRSIWKNITRTLRIVYYPYKIRELQPNAAESEDKAYKHANGRADLLKQYPFALPDPKSFNGHRGAAIKAYDTHQTAL
ncbi:MAG: hypothetical protein Q9187_007067, partial [Circinaria calcarea]